MEKKTTLIKKMPKTIEFLCINKNDKSIIQDCSFITLTDINQESSPYLLISKISKDATGASIFPGSIVRITNNPEEYYVADTFDTGEISLLKFTVNDNDPNNFFDEEEFKLMSCNTFVDFSKSKLEAVGHIYDDLRISYGLKIDHFKRLL